jgi:hypothetical protein
MNADQKRRMGMTPGGLAHKLATHKLVVTKTFPVERKPDNPTPQELRDAYVKARRDAGLPWCWMVSELENR